MASRGIEGLVIETHNWGASVAFWQSLGYKLEFETDHHSGQLRHPAGGPFLFVVERPSGHALELQPVVALDQAAGFEVPTAGKATGPFVPQHWGVEEMLVEDPDGRRVSVQAPLPAGTEAPPGH